MALLVGCVIGVAWTLSPLTLLFAAALVPLFAWAGRSLGAGDRRWMYRLLIAAIALRALVMAALFLSANPNSGSFATFFGDEQYLELRALWLHNLWLGLPMSRESFLYADSATGWSSYIPFIAYIQVLTGPAPYGIRLVSLLLFLAGNVALFHMARRSYGAAAAFTGLTLLLMIPSLFMWSVSALKEPMYLFFVTISLLAAIHALRRDTRWFMRILALLVMAASCAVVETVRPGGRTLVVAGVGVGLLLRLVAWNRRVALVSALAGPAILAVALSMPAVQERAFAQIRFTANWHRGHVFTIGHSFKTLDQRFYYDRFSGLDTMTGAEAGRYIVRAAWAFATMPMPWQIVTRSELLLIPEQVLLFATLLLLPIGIAAAAIRDPMTTSILCGYSLVSAATIAMTSGNVGTLVRHRALVIPYIVWFSALGAVHVFQRVFGRQPARVSAATPYPTLRSSQA
jgi:hypothetical protein